MDDLVIDCLAVYRLSRLVAQDQFPPVRKTREAIWRVFPDAGCQLSEDDGWRIKDDRASRWYRVLGLDTRVEVAVAGNVVIEAHPIAELLGCNFCNSVWLAFGVLAARRFAPRAWDPVARALAASAVAGVIASTT